MTQEHGSAVTARAMAALAVLRVIRDGRYLDSAMDDMRARGADASVNPLIQELAYGTLRWYHQLAGVAKLFVTRPFKVKDADVHALLLVGLYQLRYMRVAGHAAVDTTVEATELLGKAWAKGVINACLRAYLRETPRVEDAISASVELQYSHPSWLIDAVRGDHAADWSTILVANNERPPLTVRVNAARVSRSDYLAELNQRGVTARAHSSVETAVVIENPLPVEQLPGFKEGQVSVQDAAAQLAAVFLDARADQRVLDACAAPGGKAAHILERTPSLKELTALDVEPQRLQRVRENLERLKLSARLMAADAADPSAWWDGSFYDRILLDVPCTATGVIRRHPDIKVRRQPGDLPKLLGTQAKILAGVWPSLTRGGKLLYVTCSVLSAENDRQIRSFLALQPDAVAESLGTASGRLGYQILPGEDDMDGFYYACLRKA
jgi:16S rRNA (cytosine967-C5)-methyltransferase